MEKQPPTKNHSVKLFSREKAELDGVCKVLSYGENEICLDTACGRMTVLGESMKIEHFDENDGSLCFSGKINSLKYAAPKIPLVKRLFK